MNKPVKLLESLNEKSLDAKVTASNWEDAVEKIGKVMIDAQLIEESYIAAMKKTVKELGPYCVIAPGIAMPHARPEDGVLKSGFSLITLESPVEFGSSINDPVNIVIGFSALNKEDHIQSLRELGTYLGNQDFVQSIRNAKSKQELVESILTERNKK